ncbi:heme-dependent catalase [Lecanosticta acicola]|uniref:Heme-dependent catalase n=1 Tax=Lecanosticta acicola TaxID=111012 RepID=A0AAI9ED50_9PEZI|nr:heme-dependent catalase [Lecanosticta acicola]
MGSAPQDKYIPWDAPGVEVMQPGEKEKIWEVSNLFNRLQMMNFNEHMHCLRGTHLKTQGCVIGRFVVHENLPEHLAQGMFAKPGSYDCIMRYSSLTPKLLPDNIPQPRGIGIKIFGIEGEKMWGEDKKTQDWTFNNYPVLELRTPKDTFEIIDSLERNWNTLEKFAGELGERPDAEVATMPAKLPKQHMVAMPEWSQSAYRHGDYVAKYGVFPKGQEQINIANDLIKDDDPINILSQHTRNFHLSHKVTYSFCAQMLQNLDEQPVDDIGVEWDEKRYPMEEIAHLEFDPQDSWLPEFRVWWDDRITVNSWHGLKLHQPLGSTNRMRRVVYAESRKLRMKVNGNKEYIEPASIAEVPAPIPAVQLPYNPKSGQNAINSVQVKAATVM